MTETQYFLLLVALAVITCYWAYRRKVLYNKKRNEQINEAKRKYDLARVKKDKSQALLLGREYYRLLRDGPLSIYDEQAITNDLLSIGNENPEE